VGTNFAINVVGSSGNVNVIKNRQNKLRKESPNKENDNRIQEKERVKDADNLSIKINILWTKIILKLKTNRSRNIKAFSKSCELTTNKH
jgi:hypothetical protein